MQYSEGFPFWVNAVDALPQSTSEWSSFLHINDIFACDVNSEEEVWTDILLANYMIDFDWLLSTVSELRYVKNKLVILSGEKGHATVSVNKERDFRATSFNALRNTSPNEAWCASSIMHTVSHKQQSELRKNEIFEIAKKHNLCTDKITVLEPPLPYSYGTHHTKMALCVNKRGLRVAIFTANFIHDDWAFKSQGIYVQDFPWNSNTAVCAKQCTSIANSNNKGDSFACMLSHYLHDCGVVPVLTTRRKNSETFAQHDVTSKNANCAQEYFGVFGTEFTNSFDFTRASVWLVASVPGSHSGNNLFTYGINRLGYLIERIAAFKSQLPKTIKEKQREESGQKVRLSWQYSSQGVLNDTFLHRLISNMSKDVIEPANSFIFEKSYQNRKTKKTKKKIKIEQVNVLSGEDKHYGHDDGSDDDFINGKINVNLQVIYPTENEVRESLEGWRGGLSLPVRMKTFHPYINSKLYRWGSNLCSIRECDDQSTNTLMQSSYASYRVFALPHIKTYASIDEESNELRWFLLTSANLSQAAWGSASTTLKNKKKFVNSKEGMECSIHNNNKGVQAEGMEENAKNLCFEKLFIRSYELGVLYDFTSKLQQEECFTVTPSCQLMLPTINNTSNLFSATFTSLHAFRHKSKCNVNRHVPTIFLPYNLLYPTPYTTINTAINEKRYLEIQCKYKRSREEKTTHDLGKIETKCSDSDVPWAVDALHKGKDILGLCAVRAMEEHTHYGPLSQRATVRSTFPLLSNLTTRVCSSNTNSLLKKFLNNVEKCKHKENLIEVEHIIEKTDLLNCFCYVDSVEVIDVDAEVDNTVSNDDNVNNDTNKNIEVK